MERAAMRSLATTINYPEITADVDLQELKKLKQMLDKYEELLEMLQ